MSTPHQTTPFRRPSHHWGQETHHDPAEMGTDYGLEMQLHANGAAKVVNEATSGKLNAAGAAPNDAI